MIRTILFLYIMAGLSFTLYSQQTVGLFINDSTAFNGYTLFAPTSSRTTYLIDNCGATIHTWTSDFTPGSSVYLLENGNLLRTARINSPFNSGGTGGRIELFSWEGEMLWSYNYSSETFHQHHDIEPLPNGNILVLAWEFHTMEEAITQGRNPSNLANAGIWSERIVEIEMVGINEINTIWEWHLWDHLVQDFDSTKANYGIIADHPELMDLNFTTGGSNQLDWLHYNGIDYHPGLDQILISSRSMSEIYIIDHSTTSEEAAGHLGGNAGKGGDFLYRWGNPRVYNRGILANQQLFGQHDPTWIPEGLPDEGNILLFNNGQNRPGGNFSTVDLIDPPIDQNGHYLLDEEQAFGPEQIFWTFEATPSNSFYSPRISGAQRLPNGNTLICEGADGHFFEVNNNGSIVWKYISPISGNNPVSQGSNPGQNDIFRATKYAPSYGAFINKDLTPGPPIELNPIDANCQIFDEINTAVEEPSQLSGIRIGSNPFSQELVLNKAIDHSLWLNVADIMGKNYLSTKWNNDSYFYNTTFWPNGLYILSVYDQRTDQFFIQKIIKQ